MQTKLTLTAEEILSLFGAVFEANGHRLVGVQFFDRGGATIMPGSVECICDDGAALVVHLRGPETPAATVSPTIPVPTPAHP